MTGLSKRVTGSAVSAATLAVELTAEVAEHATPAETKALHEALALLKSARHLLAAVESGRVEARAKFAATLATHEKSFLGEAKKAA
jgi:hypothetical protein